MLPSSTQYVSLIPQPSQKPACKKSTENKYLYLCYQNPVKNELVHVQKRINICICEFAFETLENVVFEVLVSWPFKDISYIWSIIFKRHDRISTRNEAYNSCRTIFVDCHVIDISPWRHDHISTRNEAYNSCRAIFVDFLAIYISCRLGDKKKI